MNVIKSKYIQLTRSQHWRLSMPLNTPFRS
jgi:hypothetical protein